MVHDCNFLSFRLAVIEFDFIACLVYIVIDLLVIVFGSFAYNVKCAADIYFYFLAFRGVSNLVFPKELEFSL